MNLFRRIDPTAKKLMDENPASEDRIGKTVKLFSPGVPAKWELDKLGLQIDSFRRPKELDVFLSYRGIISLYGSRYGSNSPVDEEVLGGKRFILTAKTNP